MRSGLAPGGRPCLARLGVLSYIRSDRGPVVSTPESSCLRIDLQTHRTCSGYESSVCFAGSEYFLPGWCLSSPCVGPVLVLRLTARVKGVSIFLTICAIVMFLVSFLPIWGFCGRRRFADFCFSSVLGHEEPVVKRPFPVAVETASIVGHAPRPRGSARLAGGRDEPRGSVAPRRSGRESWLSAFFTPAADVFLSSLPFRMIHVANPLWALTQIGLNYRVCLRNSTPG